MNDASVTHLDALTALTRRYAAWGRGGDEGGLPLAWGGLTMLLLALGQVLLSLGAEALQRRWPHPAGSSLMEQLQGWNGWGAYADQIRPLVAALLPLAWVLGKDRLRARLYQPLGRVEPPIGRVEAWVRRASRTLLVAAGVGLPFLALWRSGTGFSREMPALALNLGLTACWALPWLGWTRVRGSADSIAWTLMSLLALLWLWLPASNSWLGATVFLSSFLGGPILIAIGLMQHLRFRRFSAELRALEAQ